MTSYKPGDVVLVSFPFTDQSGTKKRPGVVVSSETYNADTPDVIILPITSKTQTHTGFWGIRHCRMASGGAAETLGGKAVARKRGAIAGNAPFGGVAAR